MDKRIREIKESIKGNYDSSLANTHYMLSVIDSLQSEIDEYKATAALNSAGVNLHKENKDLRDLVERQKVHLSDFNNDLFHERTVNERYKERNKKLSTKLSTATTERDKLRKEVKGYESILLNLKKYLEGEKETADYTHVPHLLDYIKDLERVARK